MLLCKTGLVFVGGKESLRIGNCLSKEPLNLSLLKCKLLILQAQSMLKILLSSEEFICYRSSLLLNPVLSAVWTTTDAS